MTAFPGYLWPDVINYQEPVPGAISANPFGQPAAITLYDPNPIFALYGTLTRAVAPYQKHSYAAYVYPSYADDLFNHFLVVPSILTLGNLLTDQTKSVEIANMYFIDKQVDDVINHAGGGIIFPGLPAMPVVLKPFGSLIIDVQISAAGQPSINGTIEIDAGDVGGGNVQALSVPVTGQRITLWVWSPEQFYTEELQWKTDILESFDGTEQRIKIRANPRQVLTYTNFQVDPLQDIQMRLALFNWMAQVWGVPIWWEQAPTTSAIAPGASVIPVLTANADYRADSLVFIRNPLGQTEAFEIDSFNGTGITITSNTANTYPKGSQVMPIRTAYARAQTQQQVYITGQELLTIQFTTLDNINLAAIAGSFTQYQGLVVLDDINFVDGQLSEGMQRNGVVIIDNDSGRIYQAFNTDRSKPLTVKTWWTDTKDQIWPLRQLFHALGGSQGLFWLPTNRNDLQVAADIAGGSTTFSIKYAGYTLFGLDKSGVPMRPFGDIRFTLNNGTKIYCQILGSVIVGGVTETITVTAPISGPSIPKNTIARLEFVQLMRIADDKATLTHDHPGRAEIVINCIGVKS